MGQCMEFEPQFDFWLGAFPGMVNWKAGLVPGRASGVLRSGTFGYPLLALRDSRKQFNLLLSPDSSSRRMPDPGPLLVRAVQEGLVKG